MNKLTSEEIATLEKEAEQHLQVLKLKVDNGAMSQEEAGRVYGIMAMKHLLDDKLWPDAFHDRMHAASVVHKFIRNHSMLEAISEVTYLIEKEKLSPKAAIISLLFALEEQRTALASKLKAVDEDFTHRVKKEYKNDY